MPRRNKRVHLLFISLFFLWFAKTCYAQQTSNVVPLTQLIPVLESRFDVKFSYVDADLKGMDIFIPEDLGLPEILQEISRQTQLEIANLNPRYYSIIKARKVSVCATVLDNFEENTLLGASVEVLGGKSTVTDESGAFFLEDVPRDAIIRIRYIGFKPLFIPVKDLLVKQPCKTLLMAVHYQELQEVVVYKFLTTGLSKVEDGSIAMEAEEFGILPGLSEPDVLQTIQALPGIKSFDETVSNLNIRGGTNDQNLLLWDGIKMYQSGHFFGLISAFNPYLTNSIKIIKNGASAQYGEGVSGIVSMESQDEIKRNAYGGAGLNLITADLYGHIPINDRWAFQFSGRRSMTDFLNSPTYSQFFDKVFQDTEVVNQSNFAADVQPVRESDFYFYDLSAKVLYDHDDRHRFRANFFMSDNDLSFSETNPENGRSNFSNLDQLNLSFGGRWEASWDTKWSSQLNLYYTRYNLDADVFTRNGTQQLFQNNEVKETAVKTLISYQYNPQIRINSGYQLVETGVTDIADVTLPSFTSRSKDVIRAHGLFTELQFKSADEKFYALAGGRLNLLQNLGTFNEWRVEPRLSLYYKLSDHLRWELLGEFKNQTSHQRIDLEQNFLGVEKRRWVLSDNDDFPIVKSQQYSSGFFYDRGHWLTSLELFYKDVAGISTETQGFFNEDQFEENIGDYTVKGLEYLINYKSEVLSSWISYTYNQNDYFFPGLDLSEFPNNLDIRHVITAGTTFSYENFKLGLGINYRTGRPFTEPIAGPGAINRDFFPARIVFNEANSSRLPEYFRADASFTYAFELAPGIRATAGASVLNFTDRRNILNKYYRLNNQEEIEAIETFSLGITPNLSFRVDF